MTGIEIVLLAALGAVLGWTLITGLVLTITMIAAHHDDASHHGPLTPVLDADGLPVVRTVGDLTMRHVGRRVRVEFDRIPALHELDGQLSRMLVNSNGVDAKIGGAWYALRAEVPCEVLDA